MRPIADKELVDIASGLDNPNYEVFEVPLPAYLRDGITWQLSPEGMRRNIVHISFGVWHSRCTINGVIYTVGRTSSAEKAMRFADMAAMWFWPYRQRRKRPPGKNGLNFTVEQAMFDCANEASARSLLIQIENLLASRLLLDVEAGNKARQEYKPGAIEKVERKSVRARLALLEKNAHIPVDFSPYIERIEQLESQQHELIAAFAEFLRQRGQLVVPVCTPEKVC